MRFTETMLDTYAAPLSQSEDDRCKNAINMVRDALKSIGFSSSTQQAEKLIAESYAYTYTMSSATSGRKVKLLVQGSYANDTNVKQNSDVDIAVILESAFIGIYRPGVTRETYGFTYSSDSITKFKDDVERILEDYFVTGVERKNKSIKIYGNSYRVDADTVPCMRHRDYSNELYNNSDDFVGGIVIHADDGSEVINYPEQHIRNGKIKNTNTNFLYKKMVRIIKKMRYMMEDSDIDEASNVSSFVLESLLWNVSNEWYMENRIYRKVYIFNLLIQHLISRFQEIPSFLEANGIKALCPDERSRHNLKAFISKLSQYYEYE